MKEKTETSGHTPGPWSVDQRQHSVEILVGPDEPSTDVIKWRLYGGEDVEMDAVTIANARLIAAAPDLMIVAKEWVEYFDNLNRHSDPDDPLVKARNMYHAERVERTRAAIAKAEGRQ